jgi:hypothetical protein
MANRKMLLSGTGKQILDRLCEVLEIDRPYAIKIALAKGLSISNGEVNSDFSDSNQKWTIPDGIIRDKEYLLFKHLIINELEKALTEDEVHHHMILYIEYGLRIIEKEIESLSSLEDYRLTILGI